MKNALMAHVEAKHLKAKPLQFEVGDIVDVHQAASSKATRNASRFFSGTVIQRKGESINETFTVRRIVNNEGVERIFPVNSPKIEKLEVKRKSRVRRAKLYFLRQRTGKATRLKEGDPIVLGEATPAAAASAPSAPAKAWTEVLRSKMSTRTQGPEKPGPSLFPPLFAQFPVAIKRPEPHSRLRPIDPNPHQNFNCTCTRQMMSCVFCNNPAAESV